MVKTMSVSIPDILFRPDTFFKNVMTEDESLKEPAMIIIASMIVASVLGYVMGAPYSKMMSGMLPSEMAAFSAIISIVGIVFGVVLMTALLWVILAGIFYVLSGFFNGKGSFRRCLQVTGYGYLPTIFGSLISLVIAIEYIPRVVVPTISANTITQNPQAFNDALQVLMHDPAMLELTQITSLVAIVFLLWSANIWIFGIKHARQLSPRDAALCIGTPVVLYVLYVIYNLGAL